MAKKWIAEAIKHPGKLHRQLGVPENQTVPQSKLTAAAKHAGPKMKKELALKKTLAKFHHGG